MQNGVYWQEAYCLPYKPCHLSVSCYLKHCKSYVNSGYFVLYREQQEQKCMFKTDSVFKTYFACEVGHFHRCRTHGRMCKLAVLIPDLTVGRVGKAKTACKWGSLGVCHWRLRFLSGSLCHIHELQLHIHTQPLSNVHFSREILRFPLPC